MLVLMMNRGFFCTVMHINICALGNCFVITMYMAIVMQDVYIGCCDNKALFSFLTFDLFTCRLGQDTTILYWIYECVVHKF